MPHQHIDLSNLDRLFKGDRSRVEEWIRLYFEEAPQYFQRMEEGLRTGDANILAAAAHDLCPQAHYLGSSRMLELLVAVEAQAREQGTAACADTLQALLSLSENINSELHEALGTAKRPI